jgi:thymidylate synthase
MEGATFRNVSFATATGLRDLLSGGISLRVREQEIKEIRNRVTVVERPRERCLFLPSRGNSVFASLAETFWVLAGRNDVDWLQAYLPRAPQFSDDGRTWRGGYGPRLRNWNGVDQVNAVRKLLLHERSTRRAAMVLFDPDHDFVESNDIPCNNWLHWLIRDNHLHLNVAMRSNDVVWGFSAINCFEWSVLHEMMSFWTGALVGDATYLASSFHIYQRHYEMATKVVAEFRGVTCYDFGVASPPFQTPWNAFDESLKAWFAKERDIRRSPHKAIDVGGALTDPFMTNALQTLRLYHGHRHGWDTPRLRKELAALPETDLTAAAYDYFARGRPEILEGIEQPAIAKFFRTYGKVHTDVEVLDISLVKGGIKQLHRQKNAAYGNAWKKRGELTSILANIARKVDRLDHFAAEYAMLIDESIVDTVVDLLVYVTKYRLYLLELTPDKAAELLPSECAQPFSDHVSNFDRLVDQLLFPPRVRAASAGLVAQVVTRFQELHSEATAAGSSPDVRFRIATELSESALRLFVVVASEQPHALRSFLHSAGLAAD